MIRMRKGKIKVQVEAEYEEGGLESTIDGIKELVADAFTKLAPLADSFDEVRIAKDGTLHCRDLPASEEEQEGSE